MQAFGSSLLSAQLTFGSDRAMVCWCHHWGLVTFHRGVPDVPAAGPCPNRDVSSDRGGVRECCAQPGAGYFPSPAALTVAGMGL